MWNMLAVRRVVSKSNRKARVSPTASVTAIFSGGHKTRHYDFGGVLGAFN